MCVLFTYFTEYVSRRITISNGPNLSASFLVTQRWHIGKIDTKDEWIRGPVDDSNWPSSVDPHDWEVKDLVYDVVHPLRKVVIFIRVMKIVIAKYNSVVMVSIGHLRKKVYWV